MRKVFVRVGIAAGAVAVLAVTGFSAAVGVSHSKLTRKYDVALTTVTVPGDAASIEWGGHLVKAVTSCQECHGADLSGQVMIDDPAVLLAAPNLTSGRGGIGGHFTVEDWVRAIRHGVRRDGSSLLVMPSYAYAKMSDRDLGAMIAYLRQLPAVDNETPSMRLRPLGRALVAVGAFDDEFAAKKMTQAVRVDVEPGVTVEYGTYLAGIGGCTSCHRPDLKGGPMGAPGAPPATGMNREQYEKIREGNGFIAALDQSGGSTPKALKIYGVGEDAYGNEEEMFDRIHEMRTRIITSPPSTGTGSSARSSSRTPWTGRSRGGHGRVPLVGEAGGPVPQGGQGAGGGVGRRAAHEAHAGLDGLLARAREKGVFGTKMRSVIKLANGKGVEAIADQQFEVGRQILAAGAHAHPGAGDRHQEPGEGRGRGAAAGPPAAGLDSIPADQAGHVQADASRGGRLLPGPGGAPARPEGRGPVRRLQPRRGQRPPGPEQGRRRQLLPGPDRGAQRGPERRGVQQALDDAIQSIYDASVAAVERADEEKRLQLGQ
jgi:cytochrome c553